MRNVSAEVVEKIKAHILCSILFSRDVDGIMWKNTVAPDRLQMTRQYGALHAGYVGLHTNTQNL